MNNREKEAQAYIDALSDPQCFCEGRLFHLRIMTGSEPMTNAPNCEARDKCRMFNRSPVFGKQVKVWRAISCGSTACCSGRKAWEEEQKFEQWKDEIDSMEWIVTIGDRSWQVKQTTAQMAVMLCMVQLRREGMQDNEVRRILDGKLYQVREV